MKLRRRSALNVAALCISLSAVAPLAAHHSTSMFDQGKTITITGIVKRVDLKNPHSMFYIAVADEQGNEVEWALEAQPRGTLLQIGWAASTLKIGDKVTAAGNPARHDRRHRPVPPGRPETRHL